jgi:hypothetical protein
LITVPWVPQYRLRADCSRTARRFSVPGKLLRMDGRVQAEAGQSSLGLGFCRRSTATSWRSTSSSVSFYAAECASHAIHPVRRTKNR